MPYTFGGATSDDVTWASGASGLLSTGNAFVSGWWRPTTLTATRGLWSVGAIMGAEIDSTTDELRMRMDYATDGEWTTSGVDLVTDEWHFLAFLVSMNATTTVSWRVWRATLNSPITEATVTQVVAPSGTRTGNSVVTVGNKGASGTLAFQGDIAQFLLVQGPSASPDPALGIASLGTITQTEADQFRSLFVEPAYRGEVLPLTHRAASYAGVNNVVCYWPGLAGSRVQRWGVNTAAGIADVVPSGVNASIAQTSSPYPQASIRSDSRVPVLSPSL